MTNEMRPPHEQQQPFFKLLGDELITLTPDHWRQIKLSMARADLPAGGEACVDCAISSPEGFPEKVSPSERLLKVIADLDGLFRSHGATFRTAECYVREEAPDSWRVVIDYRY